MIAEEPLLLLAIDDDRQRRLSLQEHTQIETITKRVTPLQPL